MRDDNRGPRRLLAEARSPRPVRPTLLLVTFERHLERAVAIKGKDGFATVQRPKNEWSKRKVPLHPAALAALREWWDEGWEQWTCKRPTKHDYVFPRPDRKPQRPRSAQDLVEDLKTAELPHEINGVDLVFHDARACTSTWMTNALVPDVLIRRFLGHSPRGAAEARYIKGNILPAMMDAVMKIKLSWGEE